MIATAESVLRHAIRIEELEAEIDRLRAALQDAKELALADAPAHMIVDVCDRALAAWGRSP